MAPATQADVARAAGVSRALVSIAFRGVPGVSTETRELIFSTAKRLQYRPNKIAAQLASRQAGSVGVYLLNLRNELFADIYAGLQHALDDEGRHLVLSIGSDRHHDEGPAMDSLLDARVGVVIAVGLLSSNKAVTRMLKGMPLVSVSRKIPGFDSVYPDDVEGARLATEHLVQLGHRRIVHLASPPRQGYTDRRQGYSQTMNTHDLQPVILETDYSRAAAALAIGPILDGPNRPTAVFANNDQTALGVFEALHMRGLSCPHDVSIVGYDNTPSASLPGIALTSVDIHAEQMGNIGADLATARLADLEAPAVHRSITPQLIVRASTRPVTGGN